jgi:hypothetical protein
MTKPDSTHQPNFIRNVIEEDLKTGNRPNPMAIFISGMPNPFVSILRSPLTIKGSAISGSMIPIQPRKRRKGVLCFGLF